MPKGINVDIIDAGIKKRVDELISSVSKLNVEIEKLSKSVIDGQKSFEKNANSQADLNSRTKQLLTSEQAAIKIQNDLVSVQNKAKTTTKELITAKEKQRLETKKLTDEVRKELNVHSGFVDGIKKGIGQFALMAGAITGVVLGLKKFGMGIINATDTLRDEFEVKMQQAKNVTNYFFKALATGDFTNFFSGLKRVSDQARIYAENVDRMTDLTNELALKEKDWEKTRGELEIKAKSRNISETKRLKIIEEIKTGEEKLSKQRTELSNNALQDELGNIATLNGASKEQLEQRKAELADFVNNYSEYDAQIKRGAELKAKANEIFVSGESKIFKSRKANIRDWFDSLSESDKQAIEIEKKFGKVSGEERAKIRDLLLADKDARMQYTENTKRVQILEASLLAKSTDNVKSSEEEKLKAIYDRIAKEGEALREQEKFNETLNYQDLEIQKNINIELGLINEDINNSKIKSAGDVYEIIKQYDEQQLQNKKEQSEEEKKLYESSLSDLKSMTLETFESMFDFRGDLIDADIDKVNKQRDAEIAAAEKSGKDTSKIKAKYDKQEAALRRKAAINERIGKIFTASIDIASGIIKYSTPPLLPLLPWFIALSAVQLGMIAAAPIPKYWSGTKSHPGGKAIIGDAAPGSGKKGQMELAMLPNGEGFLSSSPTLLDLPKGTKVFPENSSETQKIINQFNDKEIIKELRLLRKNRNILLTERGLEKYNEATGVNEILRARRFR